MLPRSGGRWQVPPRAETTAAGRTGRSSRAAAGRRGSRRGWQAILWAAREHGAGADGVRRPEEGDQRDAERVRQVHAPRVVGDEDAAGRERGREFHEVRPARQVANARGIRARADLGRGRGVGLRSEEDEFSDGRDSISPRQRRAGQRLDGLFSEPGMRPMSRARAGRFPRRGRRAARSPAAPPARNAAGSSPRAPAGGGAPRRSPREARRRG